MNLLEWFPTAASHRFVPLFDTDKDLVVRTKEHGENKRKLLRRSLVMECAVSDCVDKGRSDERWHGLLYVMGWGTGPTFRPLYVGKTERKGVKNPLSANLSRSKFARWSDELDYHIGDLSHAMFGLPASGFQDRKPKTKYKRWASVLFDSVNPPRLKKLVSLYLAPWSDGSVGPSGLIGSLPAVEKEVIALASYQFSDFLLNVDGV